MKVPRLRQIPEWQPTVTVVCLILYLTLLPRPLGEEEIFLFPHADKVVHLLMFGGLTGTVLYDRWRTGRPLGWKGALIVATLSSLFGVLVEILQSAMHMGRSGNDILDIAADVAGAYAALAVCRWLHWINVLIDNRTAE